MFDASDRPETPPGGTDMASRGVIDNRQRPSVAANAMTNAAARWAGPAEREDGAVAPGGASQGQSPARGAPNPAPRSGAA